MIVTIYEGEGFHSSNI